MDFLPDAEHCFVAFDVHKTSVVVAAIDTTQQVLLQPRRVPRERLAARAASLYWLPSPSSPIS